MREKLIVIATVLAISAPAAAGVFGGFSADETTYLKGSDRICKPTPPASAAGAAASCEKADARAVARGQFRAGEVQVGAKAAFKVLVAGTKMTVVETRTNKTVLTWSTFDAIASVSKVSLSPRGALLAVEYQTRFGSRLTENVVVFVVGTPAVVAPAPGAKRPADKQPAPAAAGKAPARSKALEKQLNSGWSNLKRYRYKQAAKAFGKALALDADDPEARYGLAVSFAGRGKHAKALEHLQAIAASPRDDAIVWLVEARAEKRFKKLYSNKAFRKAVGLDPDPTRRVTGYERAVGHGGHWEQAGVPCDRPRMNLKLHTLSYKFTLALRSKCQGQSEGWTFKGSWKVAGPSALELTFPNTKAKDEVLMCKMSTCADGSGEDCMLCGPGSDLEMHLRVVRR